MAKKKRKRRKRYTRTAKDTVIETQEQKRKKFPKKLLDAFIKCSENNWYDEDIYQLYVVEAIKYLGKTKQKDPIESGRLVVLLSSATKDQVKKKGKKNDSD